MAAYGIDVLDQAVTPRRVAVLMSHLPPWARGGGDQWSTEADLLALIGDQLAGLTWVTLRAHGAKNAPRPRPIPRPRPHGGPSPRPAGSPPGPVQPGATKHGSWADAVAALAGMPGMRRDG